MKQQLLNELISSLDNEPGAWSFGRSTDARPSYIVHISGVKLWVYLSAAKVWEPREISFSLIGWFRLRRAFKRWARPRWPKRDEEAVRIVLAQFTGRLQP